ncbi:MAG: hypothetical protein FWE14_00070 [Lachnospiraceae bacterium]|nr:hypothetical protein [Lachnospiraceae bacterium]
MKPRGKRTRLHVSPIEAEYTETFGIMPDIHYAKLKRQGIPPEEIAKTIQKGIDQCYEQMREKHENRDLLDCPFYKPG